jgi:pimeloyl-ACP methyl ester carboxylesterase
MSPPPPDKTIYLGGASQPVCAVFHPAAVNVARDTAVILCPPFGWDETCSYRPRREWAGRLAEAGYPTVRLSYPGTGDSGGDPRDPALLDAWTDAVAEAAAWVKGAVGARRTVAIGIQLGGLIAYRAAAANAALDDLVLWSTPDRGRALVRQLKAFSALELAQFYEGLEPPPPLPDGELQAGGFLLSAETVQALEALNLVELPLPNPASRRVLLLERDGIGVNGDLVDRLNGLDVTLKIGQGEGYGAMTSHPQRAVAPTDLIEQITAWLHEASAPADPAVKKQSLEPAAQTSAELRLGGESVRETPLALEQSFGRHTAILTEPLGGAEPGVCAVLLNAGAVRRAGPNRMWVETARRWAARGIRTVRFDIEGIGDADGETTPYPNNGSLYAMKLVDEVATTLDALSDRGLGPQFVLVGLCASAYWSLQLALDDDRVIGAVMLNPMQLVFDPNRAAARDFRALFAEFSWSKIRKNATLPRVRALVRWLLSTPARLFRQLTSRAPAGDPVDEVLDRLRASGKPALFVFSEHEPLRAELERSEKLARLEQWDNVTVEYLPVRDHTLRPYQSQRQANALLDRVLENELVRRLNGGVASSA